MGNKSCIQEDYTNTAFNSQKHEIMTFVDMIFHCVGDMK